MKWRPVLLRKFLGFGLAGLALSILTSWGIALMPTSWTTPPSQPYKTDYLADWLWMPAIDATADIMNIRRNWCGVQKSVYAKISLPTNQRRASLPLAQVEESIGWPFPTLARRTESIQRPDSQLRDTKYEYELHIRTPWTSAPVPLLPKWNGLLLNSAFWGLAAFAIISSCRFIKRRLHRRGYCTNCRYDARGLPTCPECGTPTQLP